MTNSDSIRLMQLERQLELIKEELRVNFNIIHSKLNSSIVCPVCKSSLVDIKITKSWIGVEEGISVRKQAGRCPVCENWIKMKRVIDNE